VQPVQATAIPNHAAAASGSAGLPTVVATTAAARTPEEPRDSMPSPPQNLLDELCKLKEDELGYMEAEPISVTDWVMTLNDSKEVVNRNAQVHQDVKELAESLLQKKERYEESHALLELASREREQRRASVEALIRERDAIMSSHSPEQLGNTLVERARSVDMDAEGLLEQGLEGKFMDTDALSAFRQSFCEKKALKHRRLALKERLAGYS